MSVVISCVILIRTVHINRLVETLRCFFNLTYLIICEAFLEIILGFLRFRKACLVNGLIFLHRVTVFFILEKHIRVKKIGFRGVSTGRIFLRKQHELLLACAHIRRTCSLVKFCFDRLLDISTSSHLQIPVEKFRGGAVISVVEQSLRFTEHRLRLIVTRSLLR